MKQYLVKAKTLAPTPNAFRCVTGDCPEQRGAPRGTYSTITVTTTINSVVPMLILESIRLQSRVRVNPLLLRLHPLLLKCTPFVASQATVLSNAVHPGAHIPPSLLLLLYSGQRYDYYYYRYCFCYYRIFFSLLEPLAQVELGRGLGLECQRGWGK